MRTALVWLALGSSLLSAQQKGVDKATVERWMKELSNWGRWGAADQKGTMNLITPATRQRAAALVKEGFAVSLSREMDAEKSVDNSRPFGHGMISHGQVADPMFAMDTYTMSFHGAAMTHLDAQSHVLYQGKIYNGYSKDEIGAAGAKQLAVTAFRDGFFGRGILMDIPKLKGVKYLELSTPIYPEDLDAWEKKRPASRWAPVTSCLCGPAAGRGEPRKGRGIPIRRRRDSMFPARAGSSNAILP